MVTKIWVASQDADPTRRIAFDSVEQAEAFASNMIGWSVFGEDDPRWLPMVGSAGGPQKYPHMLGRATG